MSLASGQLLGPYRVLAPLGQGGMGEVYRALDTRLDRTVAIKVLPAALADRPGRRERLGREAQALASLNHPHIAAIYDVGAEGGLDFLVLEYVEGETLESRLRRGPLPAGQVLRHARELADALDRAHRRGVIHRDLKPGNVILARTGVKLLDFGLARLDAPPAGDLAGEHTRPERITEAGTVLGTPQYMAPEQLEGRESDARTDIFQFGLLVYEMATGRRAFEAENRATLVAAILERDPPPLAQAAPGIPAALARLVEVCLAKHPDERWQTARDLTLQLGWIPATASGEQAPEARTPRRRRRLALAALASVLALSGGLLLGGLSPGGAAPPPAGVARFPISLPPGASLGGGFGQSLVALSPDGTKLVLSVTTKDACQLHLRRLDRLDLVPIPGTEGAYGFFFSPDSRWLAFFDGGKLRKVQLENGFMVELCGADNTNTMGAAWGEDGFIYLGQWTQGLWRVADGGGKPEKVLAPRVERGERAYCWPEVLPGASAVVFTAWTGDSFDRAQVLALPLPSGEPRLLVEGGSAPRYSRTGHLLFARAGDLLAVPFEPFRLEVTGHPQLVTAGVHEVPGNGAASYGLSSDGTLVHVPRGLAVPQSGRTLAWVDRKGRSTPLVATRGPYAEPALSHDQSRLALVMEGGATDVWILDIGRGAATRLTFGGDDIGPVWSPDDRRIAFTANPDGRANLYWVPADRSGPEERLTSSDNWQGAPAFSPDGRWLAYEEHDPVTQEDIWLLPLEGERTPRPLHRERYGEGFPAFSPDGRFLAYAADDTGRPEIYVEPFPGPGPRVQVSTGRGTEPVWRRDGREIYYFDAGDLMAVPVETSPRLRAGTPVRLFAGDYYRANRNAYDAAADGRRFVLIESGESPPLTWLEVTLGWAGELEGAATAR